MNDHFDYETEKQKLEKEKEEWNSLKKQQESRLKNESNILIGLQESILNQKFNSKEKKINKINNISELQSLKLLYETKIKDISQQIKTIQEEQELFSKFKEESNTMMKKKIEDLNNIENDHNNKKLELSKNVKEIVEKEKELLQKIAKFENKKNDLTVLYNEVIRRENENKMRAKNIEDMMKELDQRNCEIENIRRNLKTQSNELKIEKENIEREKKFVQNKKNNLLLRLKSIDFVGMNQMEGKNLDEKEKNWNTQREKFFSETFNANFNNPIELNFSRSKTGDYFSGQKYGLKTENNFN